MTRPASHARARTRRRALLPLVLATMATQASIVVLAPIIVEIGRDLGASVSAIGQGRTIMAGTAVVAAMVIGPLIDRLGVRPLLVWGAALAAIGLAVTAAAPSLAMFLGAQVITGAGIAAMLSAGFAGVSAYFPPGDAAWALGYVVAAQSVAWIVGNPLIGLLTDAVSWRLAYAVPGAVALLALAAAFTAPRTTAGRAEKGENGGLRAVMSDPSARRWVIAELVAYAAWTAETTYAGAFYIHTYGVSETTVGILLAVGSLAFMAVTLRTASLMSRFRLRALVVVAALGMGVMLVVVMNVTPALWFTLAAFCVMAAFAGLRTTGSSNLGLSQLPRRPGSMMAARTASAQLGYAVGAVCGGAVLAVADFGALGVVLFAVMAVSALLYMRVAEPAARVAPEPVPSLVD